MRKIGIALILIAASAGSAGVYLFKAPSGSLESLDSIVNQRRRDLGGDKQIIQEYQARIDLMTAKRIETRNTYCGAAAIAALLGFGALAIGSKASSLPVKETEAR